MAEFVTKVEGGTPSWVGPKQGTVLRIVDPLRFARTLSTTNHSQPEGHRSVEWQRET